MWFPNLHLNKKIGSVENSIDPIFLFCYHLLLRTEVKVVTTRLHEVNITPVFRSKLEGRLIDRLEIQGTVLRFVLF